MEARGSAKGERKTITALFADIKNSMALIEDLDPEEARSIVDPALQLMMDAVPRYEGYVAQSTGDGIFAFFGAPIACEDHPQRALYAALRMQEESRTYAEQLRREKGINFQIRVGLNTGEVVLRSIRKDDLHTEYTPVGHSTSLASRMESLATPGSIVVSEQTHKLTEGYFEFKALGEARVKGVSEPIHIYEVLGVGPLRTRLQVAARRGLVRFVGRQNELEQMRRALALAKAGHGQIVGVMGEPGVGKSRLCHEFVGAQHAAPLLDLKQFILEKTEGNPFFMEEIVQALVEQGVLSDPRRVGTAHLPLTPAKPLTDLHLPPTVQAVLASRIDRLPPQEKELLQTLSVIGKEFSLSLLKRVVDKPEGELQGLLAHLQAAEFIYEQPAFPEVEYTFKHALTQEVTYNSLLLERRKVLHERTAQAIEALFHSRLEDHYSELAHHYSRSGNTQKAVEYLQRAGQQAGQRSANAEAITHLTTALELLRTRARITWSTLVVRASGLPYIMQARTPAPQYENDQLIYARLLKTLPDTPERTQQELTLQITLGVPLMAIKGYAALEVGNTYTRALDLGRQLGETSQLCFALNGLLAFCLVRAEHETAGQLAEQLLSLARNVQDPVLLVEAHRMMGESLFWLGELAGARSNLAQSTTFYDPQQHRALPFLYGGPDIEVANRAITACALWHLGYPDQALKRSHAALTLAQELAHPFRQAFALGWAVTLSQYCQEGQATQERAEAVIALSAEQGFPFYLAAGTILRGWALAEQGQIEEGIAQMRQGLAAYRATGAEIYRSYFLALLAEAYGKVEQAEEGLSVLAEALAQVDKNGERLWEAELYRLKGELTLQSKVQGPRSKTV